LTYRLGPIEPVLRRIDPLLAHPIRLTPDEFHHLVVFVRDGLLDERASKQNLCTLIPEAVPSGLPIPRFEQCPSDLAPLKLTQQRQSCDPVCLSGSRRNSIVSTLTYVTCTKEMK
jgi:hypothetical protein